MGRILISQDFRRGVPVPRDIVREIHILVSQNPPRGMKLALQIFETVWNQDL